MNAHHITEVDIDSIESAGIAMTFHNSSIPSSCDMIGDRLLATLLISCLVPSPLFLLSVRIVVDAVCQLYAVARLKYRFAIIWETKPQVWGKPFLYLNQTLS